jgi:hypothetical protein
MLETSPGTCWWSQAASELFDAIRAELIVIDPAAAPLLLPPGERATSEQLGLLEDCLLPSHDLTAWHSTAEPPYQHDARPHGPVQQDAETAAGGRRAALSGSTRRDRCSGVRRRRTAAEGCEVRA